MDFIFLKTLKTRGDPVNDMYVRNHNIYDYNTRQKFQLHISKGQTDLYAKGFYCSSILIWNEKIKCANK